MNEIKQGELKMYYIPKFRGIVRDRLNNMKERYTKWYSSYREAYEAAEKLCKRTMKERGEFRIDSVVEIRSAISKKVNTK